MIVACCKNIKFVKMKKLVLFVLSILAVMGATIQAQAAVEGGLGKVDLLVKEYSLMPDVHVISLGRLGLSAVKRIIAHDADSDTKELLSMIRKVKKVTVVDYSEISPEVRKGFTNRLGKALKKNELLLQAKDSGETLEIYGSASEDGEQVTDIVISAPGSGALICIKGSIPMSDVARIVESKTR